MGCGYFNKEAIGTCPAKINASNPRESRERGNAYFVDYGRDSWPEMPKNAKTFRDPTGNNIITVTVLEQFSLECRK